MGSQSGRGTRNAKKSLNGFQGCHEKALIESFKMSPHLLGLTCPFPFMASHSPDLIQRLAIKGSWMSAQTYQVGAHFAALIEGVLVAPSKTIERVFLHFDFPCRTVLVNFQSWALIYRNTHICRLVAFKN